MIQNVTRIACFGGIYNNYLALEAAIDDVAARGVDAIYCLGDMGAFGPFPNRVFPLLRDHNVICMQGNYDNSIGNELADCQCGYTDPRDNHFARISYDYTLTNTSAENRRWLKELPGELRIELAGRRVLMSHGSPRSMNEFLWESTTSTHFLDALAREYQADLILATHTGIKWQRELSGGRRFINVGVLGRPENDGKTNVWYTLLESANGGDLSVEFIPVEFDYRRLMREMQSEGIPDEFQQTLETGYWSTCLEVLPAKERRRGRF